jgi:hypothetical protein
MGGVGERARERGRAERGREGEIKGGRERGRDRESGERHTRG